MFVEHKEAVETTEAPAKTLKLSEAIRIGARRKPQCFNCFFNGVGTCAMGAAAEARGWTPGYGNPYTYLPEVRNSKTNLGGQISSKNDHQSLSREQIADWLESQGY
jgi:hypothetical protein